MFGLAKNAEPFCLFVMNTLTTKPHYPLLDGFRGVAALIVVCYHISEAFATSHLDYLVGHGYLAVDFFFILSGFVVGYAYDDRWDRMSVGQFCKRRLIRLQPMVVMGTLIGTLLFYTQDCAITPVHNLPVMGLLAAMVLGMLMLPITPSMDYRGFMEMYPLNGPSWSLFFEYIGNLCYALFVRRFPNWLLAAFTALAGLGLAWFAIFGELGDVCAGFALTQYDLTGGFLRLFFSFSAGLLMSRLFNPKSHPKGAFWWGSLIVLICLSLPRIGGAEHLWANGLYETLCIWLVFPFVVWLGASGVTTDVRSTSICKFMGDISYPLYLVHYPYLYTFYAWVKNNDLSFVEALPGAGLLIVAAVATAWLCMKFYDVPVRKWLTEKLR